LQNAPTQHTAKVIDNQSNKEDFRKVLFMWAFAAHTQLSLTFLHNILQK